MTNPTLERAARAALSKIHEGDGVSFFYRQKMDKSAYEVLQDDGGDTVPAEGYSVVFEGSAEDCADKVRQLNAVEIARAVLMAVREPDEAIKNAITIGGWMEQELKYDDVWQASIDAILSEKGSDDVC